MGVAEIALISTFGGMLLDWLIEKSPLKDNTIVSVAVSILKAVGGKVTGK